MCAIAEDVAADPRLIPGSCGRDYRTVPAVGRRCRPAVRSSICQKGQKLSQGAAAWLRTTGADAQSLEGGFEAWRDGGHTLVNTAKLPPRDNQGRTVWVTRARPKIDRIACPWLIRRFVDPRRRVPVRGAAGGARLSRSDSTPRRSTSMAYSGAIAARRARSTP